VNAEPLFQLLSDKMQIHRPLFIFAWRVSEAASTVHTSPERAASLAPTQVECGPMAASGASRYGAPVLVPPRLGQGAFRVAVTDAYGRSCAVTREHSLPVLEAAHIQPYALGGTARRAERGSCSGLICTGCSISATSRSCRTSTSKCAHGYEAISRTGGRITRCMGPRSSFPPQPLFALTLRCSAGMRNTSTEADGKSLAGC
jgi:hypothetical protein